MQYGNEVLLCYITDYKRLFVMFSGQAREKAGSNSWRVYVLNTMFMYFITVPHTPNSVPESTVKCNMTILHYRTAYAKIVYPSLQ